LRWRSKGITQPRTLPSHYDRLAKRYRNEGKETYQRTRRVHARAPGRRTIHPFRLPELPEALFGHLACRLSGLYQGIVGSVIAALRREQFNRSLNSCESVREWVVSSSGVEAGEKLCELARLTMAWRRSRASNPSIQVDVI